MESDIKQKRFFWGIALAWLPWVPIVIRLRNIFAGTGSSKAIGVTATAGGLVGSYATGGLAAILICEVGAMALLCRSFSSDRALRGAFSVLSICSSGLMLLLLGLSIWLFLSLRQQAQ